MSNSKHQPALHLFAVLTAVATVVLICFGGLVTSHGAGLAVPDWPNSYGYNMFLFPVSMWVGGIFYEHTHRLVASGVGLMTLILACWIWAKDSRKWLRWLGLLALALVVVQGVLGGLRVVWLKDYLGLVHGALAQVFLVLMAAIALFTSRFWRAGGPKPAGIADPGGLRWLIWGTTGLILVQLLVGAAMRHRHAGLAIPDFPAAHGRLWPATDAASLSRYNRERVEVRALNAITAYDVHLQMLHRMVAAGIVVAVGVCVARARRRLGRRQLITRVGWLWAGLVGVQVGLGAFTIWSGKAADVATAHVAVGSLTLCVGGMLSILALRQLGSARVAEQPVTAVAWSRGGSSSASIG
jgi:heme a synthase